MFTKRHTAYKVRIKDLISNEFVHREGESDFVLINDKKVSRVRVMATIVNKFTNDQRKSGTIIIDDSSETISVRAWEDEFHLIDKSVIGQLVDIIGRIRIYNDQVYLTPEIIKKVGPNWFVLRKAELNKDKSVKVKVKESKTESKEAKKKESKDEHSELKKKILKKIKKGKNKTATMEELTKIAGDKNTCKEILKKLLENDMIFEPRAGKYKLLD